MLKMPVQTKEIELDGEYKGFKCTVNTAMPMYIFTYLQTGNWDLIQAALKMVLIDWNFTDEEGKPLPKPHEVLEAKDPFGQSVMVPSIAENGDAVVDENGDAVEKPILIPAVSLIPPAMGMLIIKRITESIVVVPDP